MTIQRSARLFKDLNQSLVVEALHRYLPSDFVKQHILACGAEEKKRKKLGSVLVIYFLLYQCLFRDSNRQEVLKKLVEGYQSRGWSIRPKDFASHSGISRALKRVGSRTLKSLYEHLATQQSPSPESFYKGLRLKAYDGSHFNLEDSFENRGRYGKPPSGSEAESAWPQLELMMELDPGNRLPGQIRYGRCHEGPGAMVYEMLAQAKKDELFLLDRELGSLKNLKKIQAQEAHFLARLKADRIFHLERMLEDGSCLGLIQASKGKEKLRVRLMEYRISNPQRGNPEEVHRLVTSLLDDKQYPAAELIGLYHERWEIEISFDELKTHLFHRSRRHSFFRSQSAEGVIQELYGLLIVYFVIRSLMKEAAEQYDVAPRRLSFTGCVQIFRRGVVRMQAARSPQLPGFYQDLLDEMAATLLPPRSNRINPRVVKKHHTKFQSKRKEHRGLKKLQTTFEQDIRIVSYV